MAKTNCSITDWKLYMTDDNQTRDFLQNNPDIFSSTIAHSVSMDVIFIIISFLITVPNLLLIWSVVKTNKNMTTSRKLTIYHASTKILVGSVSLPYFMFSAHLGLPCYHVLIANAIGFVSIVVGTETVLAMTVLRYVTIVKPFNKAIYSGKLISLLMFIQLLIALTSGVFNVKALR